jgi:ElaB/YqjD/DUF883 family membrane-anchored ribosome-binding protein
MNDSQATKEKLVSDFKALLGDAEELLKATASQAGERVGVARERIEQSLQDAKRSLADTEDFIAGKSREAAEATEAYVRDNPWNAIGIAAGVGLILGLLIRRS